MAKKVRTRRARRQNTGAARDPTTRVSRSLYLGSLPPGNANFQGASILPIYPLEATLASIAQAYSEYKFTKFNVSLISRATSSVIGTKWCGFAYGFPSAVTDFAQASALSGFTSSQAFGRNNTSRLNPAASRQRWYPIVQGTPTVAQLADPNITQAFLHLGSLAVNSGISAAEIHVEYTVLFKGAVGHTTTIAPSTAPIVLAAALPSLPA